ncbi:hypothetical protein [Muriicola sp. Z0-33]|uniref:hypothetical protein n=1 Tax=Muriicola sp. Z0-33 TaxID=2816957 RepID=UPI002237CC1C|nr:hypothetical protein [Muriicola sp. Z0-33]MCW5515879.1 hypothetical protein [Muriicola sp. Z0-33]
MKTKRSIYFLLIVIGAAIMGIGDYWITKEYALSIGIVLLMFGIYKTSQLWNKEE